MNQKLVDKVFQFIQNEKYIIFGSGSTVNAIIDYLGAKHDNLEIILAFSASSSTSDKLSENNLREGSLNYLYSISKRNRIICIDSLDQIVIHDPLSESQFIKGHGAALFNEKIVWSLAEKVLIVLNSEKITNKFTKFIPVEVVPTSVKHVIDTISRYSQGFEPKLRVHGRSNSPVITDNGNYLVDIYYLDPLENLKPLHDKLKTELGVLETGIFTNSNFRQIELLIGNENEVTHRV